MTKAELIERLSTDAGVSKSVAEKVLNGVTENITRCLKKGDKITLTGFGTFTTSKRKARTGRNPQTGQVIAIKATRVPRFKAGRVLKDKIAK